jgi:hypothetical protein
VGERFLHLVREERREILDGMAAQLGRLPVLLEKDVWVCWTLARLFTVPDQVPMAFKGGTSLSKVYGAIARFSEDLDITLDCRALVPPFEPFSPGVSRSALRRHRDRLEAAMAEHVRGVVAPALRAAAREEFQGACEVTMDDDDDERVWIHYESALPPTDGGVARNIQIEFGGVNCLEPSEPQTVTPYLTAAAPALEFPIAQIAVLRPERTFWEKATLIHVECNRVDLKPSKDRLCRHWCDVALLADHDIGRRALADRGLLESVVQYKSAFYSSSHANYAACLDGGLRLIPAPEMQRHLRADLQKMVMYGMFEGPPPDFDEIVKRLRVLELAINEPAAEKAS